MYRPEQKRAFLDYYIKSREESTVQLVERIFNSTELLENQLDKDVSEFNQIEVLELLKNYNSRSPRRLMSTCKYLSDYYIWVSQVEMISESIINPFDKTITDDMINNLIPIENLNQKFFTKEYLVKELNDNVPDVTNQFIAYARFCGLSVEELIKLKINDLDFNNNKVKLITGREIAVDILFKHLMIEANDQTQYFPDGMETEYRNKRDVYGQSDYVIKKCGVKECDAVRPLYINFRMNKIKEEIENEFISLSTLYKNGLISYIKERFEERNIDLKTALLSPITGRLYTYAEETKQYIEEFGSKLTVKMLRMEIKDYFDCFEIQTLYRKNIDLNFWDKKDNIAYRIIDETIFHDEGFEVSQDIVDLWQLDNYENEKKHPIKFVYLDDEYNAYFIKKIDSSLIRICWERDFRLMIRRKFTHYIWSDNPIMRFEKMDNYNYKVSFIIPKYIDEDIESEIQETMNSIDTNGNEEGKTKYYYSKKYERNKENRKKALIIHGTTCACCDFDFEKTYGDRGIGFIEIHHKNPLYNLDEEKKIDPKEDLIPVCSNCHRIIHRDKDNVLTVEQVRELIALNKK